MRTGLCLATIIVLTGCAQNPYRAVYEGIRNQQEALKSPSERTLSPPLPSYDSYHNELERKSHGNP